MRYLAVLFMVLFIPATGFSATIVVPDDYPKIQQAINAAMNGDTVLVKPGIYKENIDFKGKAITLTSEKGASATTIDGHYAGDVVICDSGEGPDTVLDGFKIIKCGSTSTSSGHGMMNVDSSPTVTKCTFTNNHSDGYGGGMYNYNSSPTVMECIFTGNSAWTMSMPAYGGGMYNGAGSKPKVADCTFSSNSTYNPGWGGFGGGMANCQGSGPTVSGCTFIGNTAHGQGGGIYNEGSSPTVINCTISENEARWSGGGMENSGGSPKVTNCTIFGNSVENGNGGGIGNYGGSPTISNCTIAGNSANGDGGGMKNIKSNPTVINCTISDNSVSGHGGGIYNEDSKNVTLINCILWGDDREEIYNLNSLPTVTYCCIEDGWPGARNIDSDPLFVDPANGDFHIQQLSPCINRGTNAGAPLDDIDGDERPYMGTVDMGSDEFTDIHHLEADYFSISEMIGGTIQFSLDATRMNANRSYYLLGSVTGTAPGTILPGGHVTLPLNHDFFTDIVIAFFNTPVFADFAGTLDFEGYASAVLDTQGPIPGTAGIILSFAYCLDKPFDFASNPISVEIVP